MARLGIVFIVLIALSARAEPFLEDTGHRTRWGLSAAVGSSVGRGGVALGAELRLGYQLTRQFSVFGTLAAGGSFSNVYGGQAVFGAVAEFTLVDWFYFGAGLAASAGNTTTMQPQSPLGYSGYSSDSGVRPALDLRVGFSTGTSQPPFFSRGGFNIGIHALLMLHPNTTSMAYSPSGQPIVSSPTTEVSFTPMLTLGFDSR